MATYTLVPLPRLGITPEGGMLINTYAAGGSTPAATYTDSVGSATNENPIKADGFGLFPAIYLPLGTSYKFICTHANGASIWTQDGVASTPTSSPALDLQACTAGETLLQNAVVYLSKGDGGKTPGLWYNADNTNAYSSATATLVGIVPFGITALAQGAVRLGGQITGLAGLAVSTCYVGVAGAITATAPTIQRAIGAADSTTSMILFPPDVLPSPVSAPAATDGQILIGKTSDHTLNLAAVTAGTGAVVTTGAGALTIGSRSYVLDRKTSTTDVVNSSVETDGYTFNLAANTLPTDGSLRVTVLGDWVNSSGGAINLTWKAKFATTLALNYTLTTPNNATRSAFLLQFIIEAKGATNVQAGSGFLMTPTGGGGGVDATANGVTPQFGLNNAMTVDTTVLNAVHLTLQWASANANASVRVLSAVTEIL